MAAFRGILHKALLLWDDWSVPILKTETDGSFRSRGQNTIYIPTGSLVSVFQSATLINIWHNNNKTRGHSSVIYCRWGWRGVKFFGKKRYGGVRFNVISVTRGWVQFPGKKRYVTLEWPPNCARHIPSTLNSFCQILQFFLTWEMFLANNCDRN